ncbi:STAS domain-containing protein [Kutzneria viridogrisea]|uniref:Anti-sigma factor antagonist n=2 Tax=Kutzneria TaxID=43356 RepID=W5WNK2_9PSEU|nr:STAS domain-containing protein [Kutzneria albida]AHH99734.1 hypothetical protein KALB_6374 [Kutzneria albida DSM 43870]MBA8924911.1 anti-anti-sigma factor [Kutzneria viridogrisea]
MTDNNNTSITLAVREVSPEVAVISIGGEVDMLTAPELREAVDRAIDSCRALVLDLNAVTFLGSAGLAVLVETSHEANRRGVPLRLVASSRTVCRPLEVTGLTEVLSTYGSLDEAVAAAV